MQFTSEDLKVQAQNILTCDVCHRPIADVRASTLTWKARDRSKRGAELRVIEIRLVHKNTCDDPRLGLSQELSWFADKSFDPHNFALAYLANGYGWTAEQLKRLIMIAWACHVVSTVSDGSSPT